MDNITVKERNKMALQYGLIIGVAYILVTTLVNMQVGNVILFNLLKFILYVLYFIAIGICVGRIKKANGGYLDFKNSFSSVIVIVAGAGLLYFLYNFIYLVYINPQFLYQYKAAMMQMMEKYRVSDAQIDKSSREFDAQIAESKKFSLGKNIGSYFGYVILDSLFGLVVAAVVKKNKPVF